MKVLLINGSPRANGCTATALDEMIKVFSAEGVETEVIHVGNQDIRGCISCNTCWETGKCVMDDLVNEVAKKFEQADGLVLGSPVYYGSPNGTLLAFADRLFYSTNFSKHMKVGASVVSCRRAGNTASFDVLNKYFTISGMPLAPSTYWNQVHGHTADEGIVRWKRKVWISGSGERCFHKLPGRKIVVDGLHNIEREVYI